MEVSFDASSSGRVGTAESSGRPPTQQLPQPGAVPAGSTAAAGGSRSTAEQRKQALIDVERFLASELPTMWATGEVSKERYAPDVAFQDPIAQFTGRDAYLLNVAALRAVFDVDFTLHHIQSTEPSEVVTRFTMILRAKALPWRPAVTITGRSIYSVDTAAGAITSHREEWDALADNSFLSLEGLAYVLRSLGTVQLTPDLDTPQYTVLRATAEYEVRRYSDFMVAEVAMPAGSGAAGGDGFNELAGYIFGGNTRKSKMEMTTPVFSTAGQRDGSTGRMSFPMENQYGTNVDALPVPDDERIERKVQEGAVFAALTFPGVPFDWEVASAERQLRGALLLDNLKPRDGYRLARYNDPFVLPLFKRNEILIACEGFEM